MARKDRRPHQRPSPATPSGVQRDAALRRAQELARMGMSDEAIALVRPYLGAGSRDGAALLLRAVLERGRGDLGAAAAWAARAHAVEPGAPALVILAAAAMGAGDPLAAIAHATGAVALDPSHAEARLILGHALEQSGRAADALEVLGPLAHDLERHAAPERWQAHAIQAAAMVQLDRFGEAVELLDAQVLAPGRGGERSRAAWYLRAKALDRLARFEDAFASATKANAMADGQYDPAYHAQQVDAIAAHWTRRAMQDFPSSGCASELPVFIAGMPRSGTSLVDRIVDAHPLAAGVGELADIERFSLGLEQEWRADLSAPESFGSCRDRAFRRCAEAYVATCGRQAPGAVRVVNKALGNDRILGLVARLFPRTRVLHVVRDPRDVAISCYMGGFDASQYPWTLRLGWCAEAWRQSQRLMEHWSRELDVPILRVRYEDLVSDPGSRFPQLVTFLGLEWHDECSRFHATGRPLRTLSYDQVSRPLYTTSAGRWQRYERFMDGIRWPECD
jgi:tetratricopeptide (TPR) repeat protein